MPVPKGRGRVLRTRSKKVKGGKALVCDVMEKAGPRGGHAVCHKRKARRR